MNAALPESVDAWRMVEARRSFHGRLPLAAMSRLRDSLERAEGVATYAIDFDRDELGVPNVRVRVEAELPLVCQRTLESFALRVCVDTRLGLIARETDEASLPSGYEPLLAEDGAVRLAEVVEDELILAMPVVPVKPGTSAVDRVFAAADETAGPGHPFAVLETLTLTKR
jgi:uncharacterized protein